MDELEVCSKLQDVYWNRRELLLRLEKVATGFDTFDEYKHWVNSYIEKMFKNKFNVELTIRPDPRMVTGYQYSLNNSNSFTVKFDVPIKRLMNIYFTFEFGAGWVNPQFFKGLRIMIIGKLCEQVRPDDETCIILDANDLKPGKHSSWEIQPIEEMQMEYLWNSIRIEFN